MTQTILMKFRISFTEAKLLAQPLLDSVLLAGTTIRLYFKMVYNGAILSDLQVIGGHLLTIQLNQFD